MKKYVLFIQGGGQGAHDEDAVLAASLRECLGAEYHVLYPLQTTRAAPGSR